MLGVPERGVGVGCWEVVDAAWRRSAWLLFCCESQRLKRGTEGVVAGIGSAGRQRNHYPARSSSSTSPSPLLLPLLSLDDARFQ